MQIPPTARLQHINARKKFGRFKAEKPLVSRKAEIRANKAVEEMIGILVEPRPHIVLCDEAYDKYSERVKRIGYTASDIEGFSLAMLELSGVENFRARAGILLSALINNGDAEDYTVHTPEFPKIDFLGIHNIKKITVSGDVGCQCGEMGNGGSIFIYGNAGDALGRCMENGEIIVKGDSGNNSGEGMKSGGIRIEGNAGDMTAYGMKSGRIIIEGNAGDNVGGAMEGGEIIIRGNAGDYVGLHYFIKELGGPTYSTLAGDDMVIPTTHNIYPMKGGRIVVEGEIGRKVGYYAEGGEIIHKGVVLDGGKSLRKYWF